MSPKLAVTTFTRLCYHATMFKQLSKDNPFLDLVYLFCLSGFFLLYHLGNGSLASWDEALYAQVSKEIFLSGHWFKLTWDQMPWVDKPPIAIWVTALFYKFGGVSEFTARLFSALCGVGAVIVTYFIGRKLLNRWIGFLSALVLLSSADFLRFSRFGMMDIPLTFFLSSAFYFFWLGRQKKYCFIFSGIFLGLAFLTKSFAGLFFLPVTILYSFFADEKDTLKEPFYWIGVLIGLAMYLPWILHQMLDPVYRPYVTQESWKHLVMRGTQTLEGHGGSYYFYIRALINKYHPWILIGIFSAPFFLYRAIRDRLKEIIFVTTWMFFIFFVVTLMKTKLRWYILPIYPALSISVGAVLAWGINERYKGWVRILFVGVMALHLHYSVAIFNPDYSRAIKAITPVVKNLPKDATVFLYRQHDQPAALFYFSRKTAYLDDEAVLSETSKKTIPFYCLFFKNDLDPIKPKLASLNLEVLSKLDGVMLVGKKGAQ